MVLCKDCKHWLLDACRHPDCYATEEAISIVSGPFTSTWRKYGMTHKDLNKNYDCKLYEKKSPWWKFWQT